MIIVVNKSTLTAKPFSSLSGAYAHYRFELTLGTMYQKPFPINLKYYIIHSEKLIKTKYVINTLKEAK